MSQLQISTGFIISIAVIGCRFCSYYYCLYCPYYYCYKLYPSHYCYCYSQTRHPSSRQSRLKSTDQRYQDNWSTINPCHATIWTGIYTIYTKSFYAVLTCSSTLYRWMSSLLSITINR